jgi:NAD(P)-dependent dehydrogenase (short-subunit alcohol dehydrogenase family)
MITGVSSGIGRAVALEFARQGDRIIGIARDRTRLKLLEKVIRSEGGKGIMIPCDVRNEGQVLRAVRKGNAAFSGEQCRSDFVQKFSRDARSHVR